MNVKCKSMSIYQTNCYIVEMNGKELIIDPGVDASSWVMQNVKNPIAILNTHGHFDHVWSNAQLKEKFNIPIYVPKEDAFMLSDDPYLQGTAQPSEPDVLVNGDEKFELDDFKFEYIHFPGHTPGSSAILIENCFFSGDFIFKGELGRVDFPYSSVNDMKKSVEKFLKIKDNYKIYGGHGDSTTVFAEQKIIPIQSNYV